MERFCKEHGLVFENPDDFRDPILDYQNDNRLPSKLSNKLAELNYRKPTPIQAVAIPIILEKRDFIVMVISPTRELAIQTNEVFESIGLFKSLCVYGGASRMMQYNDLRSKRPQVIVGTPGRINDFLEASAIHLSKCTYLVLDEADRMFDMGFYPQIKKIIDLCPEISERQTLLFSATWVEKVQELADPLLNSNRSLVSIGPLYGLKACVDIKQHLFRCREFEKKILLQEIIREFDGFKILVFASTKLRSQSVCDEMNDLNIARCDYIHGDVAQERRERLIQNFNHGKIMIIFATDVASRGLDIKDIEVVVNYDFPVDVETYVHRIGRCGRNGAKGLAFTFITERFFENQYSHKKLIKVVENSGNTIPENLQL
ncbi:atp-dependent rna helicase-like protein [Dermatophagoides farinae]|uniref:RNA helicase n=1 Tax=Dermatophagoides farinae TaxID=6954 RepID=A0A9D4SIY3_DERFA|nr:atp-dependent rna helicase-like protein [Dermatophagoides farinae]